MPVSTDTSARSAKASPPVLIPAILQFLAAAAGLASAVIAFRISLRAIADGSASLILALAVAFLLVGGLLWSIFRLGQLIRRGQALTHASVAILSRISAITAGLGLMRALAGPWISDALGLSQPRLSSAPGLPDLILLLLCAVFFCAAQAMAEGVRLAEDDAHIV